MEFHHVPVMLFECIQALNIKCGKTYVDATLGGAGHSLQIAQRIGDNGRLIGIDRDEAAIAAAKKRLFPFGDKITYVHDNFSNIENILNNLNIDKIDGALIDLGVSSYQLDEAERGFSYINDAPLDMRMDRRSEKSAYNVVNEYSQEELGNIIFKYGEERWAKRIAQFITEKRKIKPIETTGELCDVIYAAIPAGARETGGHPAKRTFQAIRIEVNGELEIIETSIRSFVKRLNPKGRLAIITFHSLEDRIVKETFADLVKGCICPKEFPVCVCNRKPEGKVLTKKPITATQDELERNSRSKSAKLRVFEKK